jgi:hypothetical protein
MALSFEEVNVLGNIINDTFGKASTNYTGDDSRYTAYGPGEQSSTSTKAVLHGEILTITSLEIVNLGQIGNQHHVITQSENLLNQHIKKYIAFVKKEFKKKEKDGGAGRALKCKQIKHSERNDVEMINHYANNRRAIIRRSIDFEVD